MSPVESVSARSSGRSPCTTTFASCAKTVRARATECGSSYANLVGDWFLPGQQNAATSAVFDAYRASTIQFVAPDTLAVEFAHALGKELRRKHLTIEEAREIWGDFRALLIDLRPIGGLVGEAFRLATDHNGVVYDALYVALAQAEGVPVLTSDVRMRNAFLALDVVTLVTDLRL